MNKKVAIFGAGFVGFSLSVLLSAKSQITIFDTDDEKVKKINQNLSPIAEEGIQEYLDNNKLNIAASSDLYEITKEKDFYIIATPTDFDETKNKFNTESVESSIDAIIKTGTNASIIIKSTVPIGFTDQMNVKYSTDQIIFSPEFLREGHSIHDNQFPSRIITGGNKKIGNAFASLLKGIAIKKDVKIINMSSSEAEAVKLFSNTYLALRVSFFNELDTYAFENNLNSLNIINGVCMDSRIGSEYNNPSFGYGGYCLPKDSKQLLSNFKDIPQSVISAVISSNEIRKNYIVHKILSLSPKIVGIYRLTMKKNSRNFKSSAVLGIIELLKLKQVKVLIYEPIATDKKISNLISSFDEFKSKSDIIIANRYSNELDDVKQKVLTRDFFNVS